MIAFCADRVSTPSYYLETFSFCYFYWSLSSVAEEYCSTIGLKRDRSISLSKVFKSDFVTF